VAVPACDHRETPTTVVPPRPSPADCDVPTAAVAPPVQSPYSMDTIAAPVVDQLSGDGIVMKSGLAAAVLLSGGALVVLDARRRQQLRSAGVGARLQPPSEQEIETETALRALSPTDQLARIDLALRSLHLTLRQRSRALAIEVAKTGDPLYADRPAPTVAEHWLLDIDAGAWRLPPTSRSRISPMARDGQASAVGADSSANLRAGASCGPRGRWIAQRRRSPRRRGVDRALCGRVARCLSLRRVEPVFTVGLESESHLGSPSVESLASLSGDRGVRSTVGSIAATTSGPPTFALAPPATVARPGPTLLLSSARRSTGPWTLSTLRVAEAEGWTDDRPARRRKRRRVAPLPVTSCSNRSGGASYRWVCPVEGRCRRLARRRRAALAGGRRPRGPIVRAGRGTSRSGQALIVHVLGNVSVQTVDDGWSSSVGPRQELVVWLSQHRRRRSGRRREQHCGMSPCATPRSPTSSVTLGGQWRCHTTARAGMARQNDERGPPSARPRRQ
jgi:hypothetical protein